MNTQQGVVRHHTVTAVPTAVVVCRILPLTSQAPSAGGGLAGTLVQQRAAQPELGADVSPLTLNVENIDSTTLRVKLGAPGRWEVPRSLLRGTVNSALPWRTAWLRFCGLCWVACIVLRE